MVLSPSHIYRQKAERAIKRDENVKNQYISIIYRGRDKDQTKTDVFFYSEVDCECNNCFIFNLAV